MTYEPANDELQFEAEHAVVMFSQILEMLQDTSAYIPFFKGILDFQSPKYRIIINEASMLFDSIMINHVHKRIAKKPIEKSEINKHLDLLDCLFFLQNIEIGIKPFGGPVLLFKPFEGIQRETDKDWTPPTWWSAFNKLKHDFFKNMDRSTLKNAMESVFACYALINLIYADRVLHILRTGKFDHDYLWYDDSTMEFPNIWSNRRYSEYYNDTGWSKLYGTNPLISTVP
jgi:hypothetical protein